jgi:NAD-dependent SIR2 family protein deacetylase
MKNRKCTKCEKKFPKEELIKYESKYYGGYFCETCARKMTQEDIVVRNIVIGAGVLLVLFIVFIFW